jgi:hypothetical protein
MLSIDTKTEDEGLRQLMLLTLVPGIPKEEDEEFGDNLSYTVISRLA